MSFKAGIVVIVIMLSFVACLLPVNTLLAEQREVTVTVIPEGASDVQALPATAPSRSQWLVWFSITEETGTSGAEVILRSGTSVGGTMVVSPITLAPNESVRESFYGYGPYIGNGLYIDRVSGTTSIVVHSEKN